DLHRFRQQAYSQVSSIGKIVVDQVGPAITLGDHKAAGEILSSLRSDSLIQHAVLSDARGVCFAAFHRNNVRGCSAGLAGAFLPGRDAMEVSLAVESGAEQLGSLALSASVPSMGTVLRQYLGGAFLIVVLSMAIAAIVALGLRSKVSAPILAMAGVAE